MDRYVTVAGRREGGKMRYALNRVVPLPQPEGGVSYEYLAQEGFWCKSKEEALLLVKPGEVLVPCGEVKNYGWPK